VREARDAAKIQETSAEAQVRQTEGALEQAKLDLAHTRIESPINGVVISRDVDAGQTVAANFQAPELFQIAQDLSQMQVDADIDESEVAKVHVGQIAQFTVDALPNRTFEAVIRQVRESPKNIQNVITYDAVMSVPNPDLELLPGMTANLRIPVEVRENALRVPNGALRYRPKDEKPAQPTVYILNSDGMPKARKIRIGISDGLYTEVVSGDLREGDAVVLSEVRSE
jgi:HlyD family secretion protein